jgi:hypothetical protein
VTTLIAQGFLAVARAHAARADETEFALIDDEAKKPGNAASEREAAAPKPPLRDSSGRKRK